VGLWNRRVVVYAGEGGFGEEVDEMLEDLVFQILDSMHPAFEVYGVYANPSSPHYYRRRARGRRRGRAVDDVALHGIHEPTDPVRWTLRRREVR